MHSAHSLFNATTCNFYSISNLFCCAILCVFMLLHFAFWSQLNRFESIVVVVVFDDVAAAFFNFNVVVVVVLAAAAAAVAAAAAAFSPLLCMGAQSILSMLLNK